MSKSKTWTLALVELALVLPLAAWWGFAVSTLWRWFVVPLGVVQIGIWGAAGLAMLVRLMTVDTTLLSRSSDDSTFESFMIQTGLGLILPALCLGFGAIYHALA